MSFYITLPSNSSLDDFPENTLTHYTTRLKTPLRLNGNYEVALAQILFPRNWKHTTDGIIILNTPEGSVSIKIEFHVWESLKDLLTRIKEKIFAAGVQIDLEYDQNTSRIFCNVPPECSLKFENGINKVFGFQSDFLDGNSTSMFYSDDVINTNLNTVNSLYIYSDICEYQLIGDTEAPILQVVSTIDSKVDYVEKIFDSPHYIPLARNNLENIEIDIRCDLGKPIQFQSGKVIVKLHFRKKHFY